MNKLSKTSKVFIYIVNVFIILIIFFPLIFAVTSSIRPLDDVFKYIRPVSIHTFIPQSISFEAYIRLFTKWKFGTALFNSLFIALSTVFFGIIADSMAGFALAKFNFRGKKLLYLMVLISFIIPFELISIPLYNIVLKFHWIDKYQALIIPSIANGLVIFMYKQFFSNVPNYLIESALVEGCSWFKLFFTIIMPITIPASVSAGLILFMSQWESFLWPILITRTPAKSTIQVALSSFQTEHAMIWNDMFAATIIAFIIPVLLILPLQKYYIEGIAHTGTKE